jgi:hypothetical protein
LLLKNYSFEKREKKVLPTTHVVATSFPILVIATNIIPHNKQFFLKKKEKKRSP